MRTKVSLKKVPMRKPLIISMDRNNNLKVKIDYNTLARRPQAWNHQAEKIIKELSQRPDAVGKNI